MENETVPSETPEQVPTLDDVIGEFSVSTQPSYQPQAAPEPKQSPQTVQQYPATFDPLDPESVTRYAQANAQGYTALTSQIQDLSSKLTQYEQSQAQAKIEADIQSAVQKVNKDLNADPMMVELALEKFAREKPGFKAIWDNRNSNPKAYDKALSAISKELQGKFAVRPDPQLIENTRAAKSSQQSLSSKQTYDNPIEEKLAKADSPAEFDRIWSQMRGG